VAATTITSGRADFWWNVTNGTNGTDCTRTSGAVATPANCSCSASYVAAAFSTNTQFCVSLEDASPVHSNDLFSNWTVKNVRNNDLVSIVTGATPATGLRFVNITGADDTAATITTNNSDATLHFATTAEGPGAFTGLEMRGIRCPSTDVVNCIEIDEDTDTNDADTGTEDFFSTEFSSYDLTITGAPTLLFNTSVCTNANGSLIHRIDGGIATSLYTCDNNAIAGQIVP
jgi:hypothetical protein